MIEIDNASGRRWARFALVATLFVSVVANITHAVLAESSITLWLRVPGAAIWPMLSFLAIEIIVRIQWRRTWSHALTRLFILGPAIPAVIVSYEHQERLLRMMGESGIVQAIGPLAIDGLMIGCTLALLFTRERAGQIEALAASESAPVQAESEIERAEQAADDPAPAPVPAAEPAPELEPAPRAPRPGAGAAMKAAAAIAEGLTTAQVVEATGLSAPAVRRYAAVTRTLKDNPHAPIDCRALSVRPEVVNVIREWARMESVR